MGSWGSMDILSGSGPDDLGSNPSDSAFYLPVACKTLSERVWICKMRGVVKFKYSVG